MNRILATAALALALCAPVAAHAGMDEITAANFTEKYVATVAIMTRAGAKPETVCYTPEQGGGCMTIMEMTDVPQGVFYSAHQWKTSGASYTFMCLAPMGAKIASASISSASTL
jgi:hypothetical protein